ncbi:HesA/MoeB/ThiF family protein [Paraglaciecola aquimarina]|uniref:HesA/MoeB/ThiF family protein n=1 Tax=Paraglaciecola algarum TaxID=3050085 RepID=A0ABS9D855_9ALTE|nr:HesA/MoeB/ThiF family protein [Paraglaciecola sp. G1-23]MCF2949152.1 HesA/MoeB/ThiF family protein [Paraglaciecola sp. G1-23]
MKPALTNKQLEQYYRQVLLPQVEESGQHKLLQQHVLIIGVGGLGTHVAQQLSAAGIGHLHLMDDDKVETSNLPRQILFGNYDIGKSKVECAKTALNRHNHQTKVSTYIQRFTAKTINSVINNSSLLSDLISAKQLIVLDCSDNMATRQAVNRWCVQSALPLISAAVTAFRGQLLLVDNQTNPEAGCYHCVFTTQEQATNCAEMGVLGPTVATVASMQALMTIKHILQLSRKDNQLHIFDAMDLTWRKLTRQQDPQCPVCQVHLNSPPAQPETHI